MDRLTENVLGNIQLKACSYDHAIEIIKSCRIDWRARNEKNY